MTGVCRWTRWSTLIPLLIGLALLGMIGGCNTVESDVAGRVRAALAEEGLADVELLDVRYRDVTLRGPDASEAAVVVAVGGLEATRDVSYEPTGEGAAVPDTTVTSAAEPVPEAAIDLSGVVADGVVTLSGSVPDAATAAALVTAAEAAFGAGAVVDELTVAGVEASPELAAATADLAGLMPLFPGLDGAEFRLQNTNLTLRGSAVSGDARSELEAGIAGMSGLTVASDVTVLVAPAIELSGVVADGVVTLSGSVPDAATAAALVTAAEAAFGAGGVVDELTVVGVEASAELAAATADLAGLMAAFASFDGAEFRLENTDLSVRGTTASVDGLAQFDEALAGLRAVAVDSEVVAPAGEVAVVDIAGILALETITFETGSAALTDDGIAVLDRIVPVLADAFTADPGVRIEIGGHTDNQGAEGLNLALSRARAEAVRDYMVDNELPAAGLVPVGYGESEPIADNGTAEGRAQNRRIEFTVLED